MTSVRDNLNVVASAEASDRPHLHHMRAAVLDWLVKSRAKNAHGPSAAAVHASASAADPYGDDASGGGGGASIHVDNTAATSQRSPRSHRGHDSAAQAAAAAAAHITSDQVGCSSARGYRYGSISSPVADDTKCHDDDAIVTVLEDSRRQRMRDVESNAEICSNVAAQHISTRESTENEGLLWAERAQQLKEAEDKENRERKRRLERLRREKKNWRRCATRNAPTDSSALPPPPPPPTERSPYQVRRPRATDPRKKLYTCGGLGLSVFAGITFTSANVLQKLVPTLDFWQVLLYRAVLQLLVMSCAIRRIPRLDRPSLWGPAGVRWRVYLQGLLGGLLLLCIFIAIKHVPIGSASAIFFTAQAFTMMFSACILGERCGAFRIVITACIIAGALLLTKPLTWIPGGGGVSPEPKKLNGSFTNTDRHSNTDILNIETNTASPVCDNATAAAAAAAAEHDDDAVMTTAVIGYSAAVAVPILSAIITILTRQCKTVNPFVLAFWFGAGVLVFAVAGFHMALLLGMDNYSAIVSHTPVEWGAMFSVITLGICGNIFFTIAVRWLPASRAMVIRSFEVVLNYFLQVGFFEATQLSIVDPIGICLILIGVIAMNFEDCVEQMRVDEELKFTNKSHIRALLDESDEPDDDDTDSQSCFRKQRLFYWL